jgi:hypothetical protein
MVMSPRLLRPVSAGFHPEAQVWRNAVIANGGSVSGSTLKAVSDFCKSIDQAGIRDRFFRLNLFAGTGLNACVVPLYRGQSRTGTQFGNATDTNNGPFVSGDYTEAGGLNPGVSSDHGKYLDTGLSPDNVGVATGHMSIYSPVGGDAAAGTRRIMGAIRSSPQQFYAAFKNNVSANAGSLWGGGAVQLNATLSAGHTVWQRESATLLRHYTNASLIGTATSSVTPGAASETWFVFNASTGGSPTGNQYWNNALRAYSIGKDFTSGQLTDYYNAMLAFQTALGRNA